MDVITNLILILNGWKNINKFVNANYNTIYVGLIHIIYNDQYGQREA